VDITEFIGARLDEDEAAANEVHRPGDCGCVDRDGSFSPDPAWCGCGYPARVLREVAAKRAIVVEHSETTTYIGPHKGEPSCTCCGAAADDPYLVIPWPCTTLRQLANVWSDHPDYRAEWKP
jgi:hypothetical protein